MKKTPLVLAACFFMAVLPLLPAQTAAELEDILENNAISYGQAARFTLKAADLPEFTGSQALPGQEEAFSFAVERNWLPKNAASEGKASLDGVSLLIMRSFDMKGGLFYSLFRNPHYAYREMVYQELIQGRSDPKMDVSGSMLLFMINRAISRQAADEEYDLELADEEKQVQPEPAPVPEPQILRPPTAPAPTPSERAAERQALTAQINAQLESHAVTDTKASVTEEGITISLSNIQFLANSSELPESEKRKIQEIAQILRDIPMRKLLITGHTALAGTPQDRFQTSLERARAVGAYIIALGARNPNEIFVQGFGSDKPIADNNTPAGMALNRRVEIIILENQR